MPTVVINLTINLQTSQLDTPQSANIMSESMRTAVTTAACTCLQQQTTNNLDTLFVETDDKLAKLCDKMTLVLAKLERIEAKLAEKHGIGENLKRRRAQLREVYALLYRSAQFRAEQLSDIHQRQEQMEDDDNDNK